MVQESVFEDLKNTLIACRWMAGSTSRAMLDPSNPSAPAGIVTTTPDRVLKIVGDNPVNLIDSFPEASEMQDEEEPEQAVRGRTPPNTLALDDAQPGEAQQAELGSTLMEVPYRFSLAFWGANVGIAQALLNDLRDRYLGRIIAAEFIPLFDWNTDSSTPVVQMEVDSFVYAREVEEIAPYELTLFYGQLTITDFVE